MKIKINYEVLEQEYEEVCCQNDAYKEFQKKWCQNDLPHEKCRNGSYSEKDSAGCEECPYYPAYDLELITLHIVAEVLEKKLGEIIEFEDVPEEIDESLYKLVTYVTR